MHGLSVAECYRNVPKDYATAAKALGASRQRVLFAYILPNVWQALPPIALLNLAYFVIVEALLSFLALGLSPPTPSWGSILADGRQYMMLDPWMALLPGFAIIITVISISLVADGLADLIDPKTAHGLYRRIPLQAAPSVQAENLDIPPLLSVRNLSTAFPTSTGIVRAVNDVSFDLPHGTVLGVVGESGSGKSTLGLSIIQLLGQSRASHPRRNRVRRARSDEDFQSRDSLDTWKPDRHDFSGSRQLAHAGTYCRLPVGGDRSTNGTDVKGASENRRRGKHLPWFASPTRTG